MSDTLLAACQLASINWTLSGEQVLSLYRQVERIRQDMPNVICDTCKGSGYDGHPDSGAICSTCNGSGGVHIDPVWQALGASTETEALERVTILQGIATGLLAKRHYAVQSISGTHIGMWQSREDAIAVMREYPGSSLIKLYEVSHG